MPNSIKVGLEQSRARLVEQLRDAEASKEGIGGIACGPYPHQQIAKYEDAIARIDHNLRIIAEVRGA